MATNIYNKHGLVIGKSYGVADRVNAGAVATKEKRVRLDQTKGEALEEKYKNKTTIPITKIITGSDIGTGVVNHREVKITPTGKVMVISKDMLNGKVIRPWGLSDTKKDHRGIEYTGGVMRYPDKKYCVDNKTLWRWGKELCKWDVEIGGLMGVKGQGNKCEYLLVIPTQTVSGSSIDGEHWHEASEYLIGKGYEVIGTLHTHPGNLSNCSAGDRENWEDFGGLHCIITHAGTIVWYYSCGGIVSPKIQEHKAPKDWKVREGDRKKCRGILSATGSKKYWKGVSRRSYNNLQGPSGNAHTKKPKTVTTKITKGNIGDSRAWDRGTDAVVIKVMDSARIKDVIVTCDGSRYVKVSLEYWMLESSTGYGIMSLSYWQMYTYLVSEGISVVMRNGEVIWDIANDAGKSIGVGSHNTPSDSKNSYYSKKNKEATKEILDELDKEEQKSYKMDLDTNLELLEEYIMEIYYDGMLKLSKNKIRKIHTRVQRFIKDTKSILDM